MQHPIYQVDAFANDAFKGNPAAVCPLENWLEDHTMLSIAKENNLAETAFFVKDGKGYHLRWFSPKHEIDLCGHATLASAHILFHHLGYEGDSILFQSKSGELRVSRKRDLITLDFPSRMAKVTTAPEEMLKAFTIPPIEVYKSRDYMLVFYSENEVRALKPNQTALQNIDLGTGGIICTAQGKEADFVSRFFIPGAAVFEDPVTGSAHCSLIPFWSRRLKRTDLVAHQISERHGELICENLGDRVLISGKAVTYLQGTITIPK